MMTVEFTKEAGGYIRLEINGHAGQAGHGHDVVCAAASMLAYTLAQTLDYLHRQGWLQAKPVVRLHSGMGLICCTPKKEYFEQCLMAFFEMEVGFSLLAKNYPEYVELRPFGFSE